MGRGLNASKVIVWAILITSIMVKGFYFVNNRYSISPDASEYVGYAEIIKEKGGGFVSSKENMTFWRLPLLPLIVSLFPSLEAFYLVQLLLSYALSFWLYLVLRRLFSDHRVSLAAGLGSLFLPYINIAASSLMTEFLQVFLIIYVLKKIVFKEYDVRLTLSLSALSLLRPEGYTFVVLLILRELYVRNFRAIPWVAMALIAPLGWMTRNLLVFDSFSLVNPIHLSRSLIGSIYGVIQVTEAHEFHARYNYYQGFDFETSKEFINAYKNMVRAELVKYISEHPVEYLGHRIYRVVKAFSYLSFNMERLPDLNWNFLKDPTWDQAAAVNSYWSYSNLIAKGDILRLAIRVLYNGGLAMIHFGGLWQILEDYRIAKPVLFISLTFFYVFFVEADMRYFITIQTLSFAFFTRLVVNLYRKMRFPASGDVGMAIDTVDTP